MKFHTEPPKENEAKEDGRLLLLIFHYIYMSDYVIKLVAGSWLVASSLNHMIVKRYPVCVRYVM